MLYQTLSRLFLLRYAKIRVTHRFTLHYFISQPPAALSHLQLHRLNVFVLPPGLTVDTLHLTVVHLEWADPVRLLTMGVLNPLSRHPFLCAGTSRSCISVKVTGSRSRSQEQLISIATKLYVETKNAHHQFTHSRQQDVSGCSPDDLDQFGGRHRIFCIPLCILPPTGNFFI